MSRLSLTAASVGWAIDHLDVYGDTDIFPRPIELKFYSDKRVEIVKAVSEGLDLAAYKSMGILETLVPKSRLGFRIGHQPYPTDTLLLTAAIAEIGEKLEEARRPADEKTAFSYRFQPDDKGTMFAPDRRFSDWILHQWTALTLNKYSYVVKTDISDFFQRIYHHRIENCLNHYTSNSRLSGFVFGLLKEYTVRQSFGLPVGSDFSRIIAEAVLADMDEAMLREGYHFTRYVDDIVIFIRQDQDAYGALSFLAEHLAKCEGLSLSAQKTKLFEAKSYLEGLDLNEEGATDDDAAQYLIRNKFLDIYEQEDDLDPEKIEKISKLDLPALLDAEVKSEVWDPANIRVLLRAMKLVRSTDCAEYIKENFEVLLPFCKDVVLLMEEIHSLHSNIFEDMRETVLSLLSETTCQALPVVRAWLFEVFIKGICPFYTSDFRRLPWSAETLDRRQIIRLHHTANDIAYFRSRKTRLSELNMWEAVVFIYGATCLPRDEYKVWLQGTRKSLNFPLSEQYFDWCLDLNRVRAFDATARAPAPTIKLEYSAGDILGLEF